MDLYRAQSYFVHSAERIFDLVADIERYPEFLPGWVSVRLRQRQGDLLSVDQVLGWGPIQLSFRSIARLDRPERLEIQCQSGSVRNTRIEWIFEADSRGGCQATLAVHTPPEGLGLRGRLVQKVLGALAPTVLTHFQRRAATLYSV